MTNFTKLLLFIAFSCSVLFSATSSTVNFVGMTKAILGNDKTNAFSENGNELDDFNIKFKHTVNNVEAAINFGDTGSALQFDSAYLKVNDLFDGFMSLKFYDVGFSAGKDSSILPDLGPQGVEVYLKPMDFLNFTIKYGLKNDDLLNVANRSGSYASLKSTTDMNASATNAGSLAVSEQLGNFNGDLHLISLAINLNLPTLPLHFYFGAMIADQKKNRTVLVSGSYTDANGTTQVRGTNWIEGKKVQLMNAGLAFDLLYIIKPDALKVDFGLSFNGDATTDYVGTVEQYTSISDQVEYLQGNTNILEQVNNLDYIIYVYGGVNIIEELKLDYFFRYTPDSRTKHQTLGNLADEFFKEMIKVGVTPAFTIGNFTFGLPLAYGYVGSVASFYYDGYLNKAFLDENDVTLGNTRTGTKGGAYSTFEVDPYIKWQIGEAMYVKFFYEFDINLNADELYTATSSSSLNATEHTLGMSTDITFGLEEYDEVGQNKQ